MRIPCSRTAVWLAQIALCSTFLPACTKPAPTAVNWETKVERDNFDDKVPAFCWVQLKNATQRVRFYFDTKTRKAVQIQLPEDILSDFRQVNASLRSECIEMHISDCISTYKSGNMYTSELLVRIDQGPVHKTELYANAIYFSEKFSPEIIEEMKTGAVLRYRGKVRAGGSMGNYEFERAIGLADFAGAMKASQTDCEQINSSTK